MSKKIESYRKIITSTRPKSITAKEAANQLNLSPSQILNAADKGLLNWGYAFDKTNPDNPENHGQKLIVLDKKWKEYSAKYLETCEAN